MLQEKQRQNPTVEILAPTTRACEKEACEREAYEREAGRTGSRGRWRWMTSWPVAGSEVRPELCLFPAVNLLYFGSQLVWTFELELLAHWAWPIHSLQVPEEGAISDF